MSADNPREYASVATHNRQVRYRAVSVSSFLNHHWVIHEISDPGTGAGRIILELTGATESDIEFKAKMIALALNANNGD